MVKIDGVVCFPVSLDRSGRVSYIYPDWRDLLSSVSPTGVHSGILTGKRSNITVIDIARVHHPEFNSSISTTCGPNDSVLYSPFDYRLNTNFVITPNGGHMYIFKYNALLESCDNILSGVSVLNDGCCMFSGSGYISMFSLEEVGISDMSDSMSDLFLSLQDNRVNINRPLYNMLSAFPARWFRVSSCLEYATLIARNMSSDRDVQIRTLSKVFRDKCDDYHEKYLIPYLDRAMTSVERRFGIARLKKQLRDTYPHEYALYTLGVSYKKGNLIKVSDIIERCGKEYNAKKMLTVDKRFASMKLNACVFCSQKHMKGCCSEYKHDKRTKLVFIHNIDLI